MAVSLWPRPERAMAGSRVGLECHLVLDCKSSGKHHFPDPCTFFDTSPLCAWRPEHERAESEVTSSPNPEDKAHLCLSKPSCVVGRGSGSRKGSGRERGDEKMKGSFVL